MGPPLLPKNVKHQNITAKNRSKSAEFALEVKSVEYFIQVCLHRAFAASTDCDEGGHVVILAAFVDIFTILLDLQQNSVCWTL